MHSQNEARPPAGPAPLALIQAAVEQSADGVVVTTADLDPPGPLIVYANPAFVRMTGYAADELLGRSPRLLQGPRTERAVLDALRAACARGDRFEGRTYNYRKDGTEYLVDWQIAPIRDAAGVVTHHVAVQQDVTAVVQLEQQYQQAQKMEAIGRLAGGIAHDFNNLLTVIGASASFLRTRLPASAADEAELTEIETAVRRATGLTRQLLALGRQQVRQPRALDLNAAVSGVERMLVRVLGEDVRLDVALAPGLLPVLVDPGQLEQVLLNLALNARDAMPDGGTLTLRTRAAPATRVPAGRARGAVPEGPLALLGVTDSGVGMSECVAERAYEPFYTTKEPGEGTGLGLATVHGIVTQSGGVTWLESRRGAGTTVWVALPLLPADTPLAAPDRTVLPQGTGTILLVEDDDAVRTLANRMLVRGGYEVVEARSGNAALARWRERGDDIDLLVTDMVMPDGTGHELLSRLRAQRPTLPALLLSGYAPDARVERVLARGTAPTLFLGKPFTLETLLDRVAQVLGTAPAPPPAPR